VSPTAGLDRLALPFSGIETQILGSAALADKCTTHHKRDCTCDSDLGQDFLLLFW
jgi:hypothetical protein